MQRVSTALKFELGNFLFRGYQTYYELGLHDGAGSSTQNSFPGILQIKPGRVALLPPPPRYRRL